MPVFSRRPHRHTRAIKLLSQITTLRFAMTLALQSTQLAACNRLHDVEERSDESRPD